MTFGRRLVAAVVCVPLLAVGGCADDPKPKVAPPTETPTSSSPTATPTPEPWEKKTNAGAVAFAKHWVDVFNEAQRTGDTAAMRELSATSCVSCSGFADQLEKLYAGGGHLESEGWRVKQALPTKNVPTGSAIVDLRVKRSVQTIRPGDGSKSQQFPGGLATFSASIGWVASAWQMNELELLQ